MSVEALPEKRRVSKRRVSKRRTTNFEDLPRSTSKRNSGNFEHLSRCLSRKSTGNFKQLSRSASRKSTDSSALEAALASMRRDDLTSNISDSVDMQSRSSRKRSTKLLDVHQLEELVHGHRRPSKDHFHHHLEHLLRMLGDVKAGQTGHGRHFVEIGYPDLTPLWPAFGDVEFTPVIKPLPLKARQYSHARHALPPEGAVSRGEELPPPEHGRLRFEVHPPLPAKVSIEPSTGVIRGSLLTEHAAGGQYTVTARWEETGELAARCAIAFAVVPADLAAACNGAYLEQQPPAFRSQQPPQLEPQRSTPSQVGTRGPQQWPGAHAGEAGGDTSVDCRCESPGAARPRSSTGAGGGSPWAAGANLPAVMGSRSPATVPGEQQQLSPPAQDTAHWDSWQAAPSPALVMGAGTELLALPRERSAPSVSPGRRAAVLRLRFRTDTSTPLSTACEGKSRARASVFPLGPSLHNRGALAAADGGVLPHALPASARTLRTRPVY